MKNKTAEEGKKKKSKKRVSKSNKLAQVSSFLAAREISWIQIVALSKNILFFFSSAGLNWDGF